MIVITRIADFYQQAGVEANVKLMIYTDTGLDFMHELLVPTSTLASMTASTATIKEGVRLFLLNDHGINLGLGDVHRVYGGIAG